MNQTFGWKMLEFRNWRTSASGPIRYLHGSVTSPRTRDKVIVQLYLYKPQEEQIEFVSESLVSNQIQPVLKVPAE